MKLHRRLNLWRTVAAVLATLTAVAAQADGDRRAAVPLLPAYVQECGSCHLPFPPGLLPADSWQRLMKGLPRHFGTDASLDATSAQPISAWLQAHAGSGKRAREAPPEDRITLGSWFVREHREVSAAAWKRPAIGSAANCAACHGDTDTGRYSESAIRIPK